MTTLDRSAELAIIIPAYNEEGNILKLTRKIRKLHPQSTIYIVDGNSQDETVNIVTKEQKNDKTLLLLRQKTKDGRGAAVIMGMKAALKNKKIKYFLEMDADLSHNPKEISRLLREADDRHVVIASRYLHESKIIDWPKWRLRQSRAANLLINLVLKLGLKDNTNGFRCYPRKAAKLLVEHQFVSKGFILLSESAYYLKQNSFNLLEVPSTFRDRRKGKSSAGLYELLTSLVNLWRIKIS